MPNVFVSPPELTAAAKQSASCASDSHVFASMRMAPMPEFARPDAQWQQQFLEWFQSLKEASLAKKDSRDGQPIVKRRLPGGSKGSHQQWRRLMFDEDHHIEPSGDVLAQMEFSQVNAALEAFDSCLGEVHPVPRAGAIPDACRQDGRRICGAVCNERRSKWVFSLLAHLDT